MAKQMNVAVVIGSLRRESLTRKTARAMMELAPPALACSIVEIGDLPLYNEDLEANLPPAWARYRSEIAAQDAVLFFTPEYNRSLPGALKNAIDVGSRPSGKSVYDGKPAAVVSVTPFALGGLAANIAVRSALIFLNMPTMQMPEAYIAKAGSLFEESGALKDKDTRDFFAKFMSAFSDWVQLIAGRAKA